MENYKITESDKNVRLDKFLVGKMTEMSRSQIQKFIKSGGVLINDKKTNVHHFLKEGDSIKILDIKYSNIPACQRHMSPPALLRNAKRAGQAMAGRQYPISKSAKERVITKQPQTPIPEIIFEDNDILVIDKPAGLLVHARDEKLLNQEPTVVQWLLKNHPAVKEVGDNTILRPGIVHRLDKEASGVMVVAKTDAAFKNLKEQFKKREVKKEYLAWVYGKLPTDYGVINFPIGRSEEGGRMAARPFNKETLETDTHQENQESKEAITEYEVLESYPHRSLLKVFPKTGRTHQIRVHFFAFNHPLIGDPLYKSKSYKEIPAPRLLLHAHKLTFKNLDGEKVSFETPIPKEFKFE